jgi:putative methyltransferase (TIGR04325 family)
MSTRAIIRSIAPPFVLRAARRVRAKLTGSRAGLPVWERVPEGWARGRTDPFIRGWNVPSIQEWHRRQFELWSRGFEAPRPLGASEYAADSTEQHLHSHNAHVSFAYVLALAARDCASLSVLDWGGGIGQYYLLGRAVLPDLQFSYHCKDVPLICEAGRELNPDVTFHENDSCLERSYDLVLASNSLQYSEDWPVMLGKLGRAAARLLYVAQLPTVLETPSFVAVQRPYAHRFETEYLGWIFNQQAFLAAAASLDLHLVREFFFGNILDIHGVDERAVHRGFLFRSAA